MLFRSAEELLLIEYEILLVVLVVKCLAYLCIKHARWLLPRKWRVLMNQKDWINGSGGWPMDPINF